VVVSAGGRIAGQYSQPAIDEISRYGSTVSIDLKLVTLWDGTEGSDQSSLLFLNSLLSTYGLHSFGSDHRKL
jgi:hypothetical protein